MSETHTLYKMDGLGDAHSGLNELFPCLYALCISLLPSVSTEERHARRDFSHKLPSLLP